MIMYLITFTDFRRPPINGQYSLSVASVHYKTLALDIKLAKMKIFYSKEFLNSENTALTSDNIRQVNIVIFNDPTRSPSKGIPLLLSSLSPPVLQSS